MDIVGFVLIEFECVAGQYLLGVFWFRFPLCDVYSFLTNFEILVKTFRKKFHGFSFLGRNFPSISSGFFSEKELSTTFSNKSTQISGEKQNFIRWKPSERHVRHHLKSVNYLFHLIRYNDMVCPRIPSLQ